MSRHRPPPWWARHRLATAAAAGAVIVVLVVAAAMALGPRPTVAHAQKAPAAPPTGTTTSTQPWPTVVLPTIGAPGAWNPDPATTPPSTPARTSTSCSRCGQRTPPATTRPTTTRPTTSAAATSTQAAAADPQPAAELLAYVNRDRTTAGCPPVTLNPSLDEQSQTHSNAQAADDRMYHSAGPTGFTTWGENVAYGYDTAAEAHDGWMGSPPHRANILTCAYRYMGAGTAVSASGVRYWTEQFGA